MAIEMTQGTKVAAGLILALLCFIFLELLVRWVKRRAQLAMEPPLHRAASKGELSIVNALLQGGVNTNAKHGDDDATPLHAAASGGHLSVIKVLLVQKAKVTATDNGGLTPLHRAARKGHAKIAEHLLGAGAVLEAREEKGLTPLHEVRRRGTRREDISVRRTWSPPPLPRSPHPPFSRRCPVVRSATRRPPSGTSAASPCS